MASLPVHWILVRVHGHATEDEARVVQALDGACPEGETRRSVLEDPHGNPLVVLQRRAGTTADVAAAWRRWAESGLVRALAGDLDARLDSDGVLHFRIDKQEAYRGRLALASGGDAIDVQVKLKAYPARDEVVRRVAQELVGAA